MTETVEALKPQLAQLSEQERAELAHFLLATLDDRAEDGVAEAWANELDRRLDDIEGGKAVGKAAATLFEELREKYP